MLSFIYVHVEMRKNLQSGPVLKLENGNLKSREDVHIDYFIEIPQCCVVTDGIVDSVFNETFGVTMTVILMPKNDASLNLNKQLLQKIHIELMMRNRVKIIQ